MAFLILPRVNGGFPCGILLMRLSFPPCLPLEANTPLAAIALFSFLEIHENMNK
jgi:hypothetical protein